MNSLIEELMRRRLKQLHWLSPGKRSMILSFTMHSMDFGIIKGRSWWFHTECQLAHHLLIFLEQHRDHRDNLPCKPTNNFSPANISPGSLIVTALDRDQALIDSGPLTIHFDGCPDDQIHHPFHLPCASGRKASAIQGVSRLSQN